MLAVFVAFTFYSPSFSPPRELPIDPVRLAPGTSRTYRFDLKVLVQRKKDCGAIGAGNIYIQGLQLDGMTLRAGHASFANRKIDSLYGFEVLHARPEIPTNYLGVLLVTLSNTGNQTITLNRGPEMAAGKKYFDAVYMIAANDRCWIVIHPKSEHDR